MKKTIVLVLSIMFSVFFCKMPYFTCVSVCNLSCSTHTTSIEDLTDCDLSVVASADTMKTNIEDIGEKLTFNYNSKIFKYNLNNNKKTSSQFDLNYKINKYNRFGTYEQRKMLLKQMLSIGIDGQVAVEYLFPNLSATINKINKNIEIKPKDAKLKVNSNTEKVFSIEKEIEGVYLDKDKLYSQICVKFLKGEDLNFDIPIIKVLPKVFERDLKKYTNLRADFSTDISRSSADRKHNVKNALATINRYEILPGQVFSFNKVVGRRTEENGYRNAKIIVNNEFVDGVGGGVCQVSSTLYNAALLAGLDIVEANKHSKQVSYVKYGFDAMVNYGSSDLKFKNNTGNKIIIITNFSSSKARIRIFGEALGNTTYKLKNEILNIVEPVEEIKYDTASQYKDKVVYDDEWFYLKTASRGMEIKSYREKYVDNQLVASYLLRHDKYKAQNAVKVYGNKKREPEIEMLPDIAL